MADGPEYPKAAYRLGGDVDVWGRMMEVRSLVDAEDEVAALGDGFTLHPLEIPETDIEEPTPKRGRVRQEA